MRKAPANLAASVHARLLNQSRVGGRSFNELLQLYAMERFLYRLSKSPHGSKFILKGALLLRVWDPTSYRTTRDIDLLGRMVSDIESVMNVVRSICGEAVEPDGVEFESASVRGDTIVEDADYQGVRVSFRGRLGSARLDMQLDVGFGDVVTPAPRQVEFPTLLDMPSPHLSAYPAETTVAEKFQVMIERGEVNSRMKDFHDIWWLARNHEFDGRWLAEAIKKTCDHRATRIPAEPVALTEAFASHAPRAAQWRALHRRLGPSTCPEGFSAVVAGVRALVHPVIDALARDEPFVGTWRPRGPWAL